MGHDESHREVAQVHMQAVLEVEVCPDRCVLGIGLRKEGRRIRREFIEVLKDVVALDVYNAVVNQDRHDPARIDAEVPGAHVFVRGEVDRMRRPREPFLPEQHPHLLRTAGALEMKKVEPFPVPHLVGGYILV